MESRRRAQTKDELNLVGNKEAREIEVAKNKELKRQAKKIRKKQELEGSFSYRTVCWISKVFDDCYLDAAIGLFQGVGDLVNTVLALPFVYVGLVKIRSIPLTLACVANILVDSLVGMIPFWIGNICDFFIKSFQKNMRLIIGYVEDDKEIIAEVNKKAIWMAILIIVICLLIYWAVVLLRTVITSVYDWIGSLF